MKLNTEAEIRAYYEGKIDGVRLFAWWKDGEQYVGTCGNTLKEAQRELALQAEQAINALHIGRSVWVK